MPTLSWETERRRGVTRVELRVHNDTTDHRRVHIESRLDGPGETPGRDAGFLADGASCRLAPGERCTLEYTTPAPPVDPPAALVGSRVLPAGDTTPPGGPVRTDGGEVGPGHKDAGRVPPGADTDSESVQTVALPPAVAAWLAAIEDRVRAVEAGDPRAGTVGHATVVADTGTLAALERRAARLGDRLTAARAERRDPAERTDR